MLAVNSRQSRCLSSAPVSLRAGSTTARLPWTHLGSIGLSHGLRLGSRQIRRRQPWPVRLTSRLCLLTQSCTSRLMCQEALSQISAKTRTPSAASCSAAQARKAQVSGLIGRPLTKRSSVRSRAGSHRP